MTFSAPFSVSFSALGSLEELPKRLFIEASAGTGKTFSIIHLICQYVLNMAQGGKELSLGEVACLTFTRAVAREMRLRLKETFVSIRKALEIGVPTGWEYVDSILSRPSARTSCLRAVRQALFDLDKAQVSTIHVFADQLIEKWKKETGQDSHSAWIGQSQVREWLEDLIEHGNVEQLFSVYEWKAVKKYFRSNSKKAFSWLIETIQSGMKQAPEERVDELLHLVRTRVRDKLQVTHESLLRCLVHVASTLEGTCDKTGAVKKEVYSYLKACVDLVCGNSLEPLWQLYSSKISYGKLFSGRPKKKSVLNPSEIALFSQFEQELLPHLLTIIDVSTAVQRVGRLVREAFYEFSLKKDYKTPDFLLNSFLQLVEVPEFVAFVRAQFHLVIVDEFQDTDPLQWAILQKLFHHEDMWPGSLYVVGDPKQSIYLFRGADIYSYLDAKRMFHPNECVSLCTNYRATKSMVEAINKLFSSSDTPSLFSLPSEGAFLQADTLLSFKQELSCGVPPIIFEVFEGHNKGKWPSEKEEEERLLPWLLSAIMQEMQRGVSCDGIAVLVKDRYQAERVRVALKRQNIVSILKRSELVTATAAYRWLRAALKVMISPKKRQVYSDLLLAYPTQDTLAVAQRFVAGEDPFFFASFVSKWHFGRSIYNREGLLGLFRYLLSCPMVDSEPDGMTVDEWIDSLEESVAWRLDLEQLLEVLTSQNTKSLEEVLLLLEELEVLFEDDPGPLFRRSDPKEKAVSIITMHSSKGLEFQVVFVLGALVRSMNMVEETEEHTAEKIRQFYVAVTRAKERCYLPIPVLDEPYRSVSKSVVEVYFANRGKELLKNQVEMLVRDFPHLFALGVPVDVKVSQSLEEPILKERTSSIYPNKLKNWNVPKSIPIHVTTFSSLHRKMVLPFHPKEASTHVQHGILWGVKIHKACCDILRSRQRPKTREDLFKMCSMWSIGQNEVEYFVDELWSMLHVSLTFGEKRYFPLELLWNEIYVEHPFYILKNSAPVFGTYDVLAIVDGKIWIIDWKTNEEAMVSTCGNLRELVIEAGYDLQARLYKEAALIGSCGRYEWGGFFFVFSKHAHCLECGGVVAWKV